MSGKYGKKKKKKKKIYILVRKQIDRIILKIRFTNFQVKERKLFH